METKVKHAKNFKDLTGKVYGKWTVISYSHNSGTKKKQPFWNCICECGLNKIVGSNSLRNGSTSCGSCGSKAGPKTSHSIQVEENLIFKNVRARYKCDATRRGLCFELTFEQFISYTKANCFYCETPPVSFQNGKRGHKISYNGIDRVDNDLGYKISNCVTCCKLCNSRKKSVNKEMIRKAYHFLFPNGEE